MRFLKKAGVMALILSLLISVTASSPLADEPSGRLYWPEAPELKSETAVLMDADTGAVLYEKNMDQVMYPASVTKILTCLMGLENGHLSDTVTMTEDAVYYAQAGSSNLNTKVGEVFTLEQLLYGTMLKSANDMATQVGIYVGGTIEHFAEMMNTKAASLGCKNTHFVNACGMPADDHYTSAHDLALICREALKNDDFRKITGTHSYEIPPTNMTSSPRTFSSHNPLLVDPDYAYPGIIGGKTGYTDAAQSTLATFVSLNGLTLIAVTLKTSDATQAALDNRALHDYGVNNFEYADIASSFASSGGKAILPKNVPADTIVTSEAVDAFDETELTFTYDGRTVGSAVMTKAQTAAYHEYLESQTSSEDTSDEDESTDKEPTEKYVRKGSGTFMIVCLIILGVLISLVLVMVVLSVKAEQERRRRRRRRQQRLLRQQRRMERRQEEDNQ